MPRHFLCTLPQELEKKGFVCWDKNQHWDLFDTPRQQIQFSSANSVVRFCGFVTTLFCEFSTLQREQTRLSGSSWYYCVGRDSQLDAICWSILLSHFASISSATVRVVKSDRCSSLYKCAKLI